MRYEHRLSSLHHWACSVSFLHRERMDSCLDFFLPRGIIDMKRALPISGQLKIVGLMQTIRNRHLAEWRFLLFTVIVMVKLPICTVKVIGMVSTSLRRCSQPPIPYGNALSGPIWGCVYSTNKREKCQMIVRILLDYNIEAILPLSIS